MIPPYVVVHSPRRTRLSLTIRPEDGVLEVRAPVGFPHSGIEAVLARNPELIASLQKRSEKVRRQLPRFRFEEGEFFLLRGRWYPLKFSRRILSFDNAFLVPAGEPEEVRKSLEKLYRKLAAFHLEKRTSELAEEFGLTYRSVHINGAVSRWGSCSSDGSLNFSWRLIQCPDEAIDYVIIHELAHRLELNHSDRFWAEVRSMCPDFESRRAYLRENALRYSGW